MYASARRVLAWAASEAVVVGVDASGLGALLLMDASLDVMIACKPIRVRSEGPVLR